MVGCKIIATAIISGSQCFERSFKVLMGSVMGMYRGKVDGALLSKLLSDKIKEVLNK